MEKPESTKIEVYVCGTCKHQRRSKEEADDCCLCADCSAPLSYDQTTMWHSDKCPRCQSKFWLRNRRKDLKEAEKKLAEAQQAFDKQQAECKALGVKV